MQLAGALMVVLPMEHAHVAGWCSCGCAVGGAANQLAGVLDGVACWRSCAGVADGACCKVAGVNGAADAASLRYCAGVADGACCKLALSTINGIEVLPACALVRSRWRCSPAGWCS